jgi:putative phosphoesterase
MAAPGHDGGRRFSCVRPRDPAKDGTPSVKIGIVSDIHCNIAGLDRALAEMGDVDELICAGDMIYQFRFSNEVVERLRERGARIVLGNHEETFLSRDGVRARAADWIHQDALAFLGEQPYMLSTNANSKRIYVVHASPWEPFKEYIYPHSPTLRRFADFDADIVIMGHTHYQMAERVGRTLVINPGSAGEPRDSRNEYWLSFAVLDTESDEVRFGNFADPSRSAADSCDVSWTAWRPHWETTGDDNGRAPKNGPDPWSASPNS